MNAPGTPPEQERVLAELGMALLSVQHTEDLLRFTLQYSLSGPDGVSLETLERSEVELRKKTLGHFIGILRKRVDLDDAFDVTLARFLDARNILVHRVDEIPGWNLKTREGQTVAHTFLYDLIQIATFISKVLTGLAREWARQNGIEAAPQSGAEALFAEIDMIYASSVDSIFFKPVS